MSNPYATNQQHKNVFGNPIPVSSEVTSDPILVADFNKIQFTVIPGDSDDFTVRLYKSNNAAHVPPDPSQPVSISNDYEEIAYSGESNFVNYGVGFPYPQSDDIATITEAKSFVANTGGAMWIYFNVSNDGSAVFEGVNVNLFNH